MPSQVSQVFYVLTVQECTYSSTAIDQAPPTVLCQCNLNTIAGGADGAARVWDLEIGDCVLVMEGHSGPITSMAITDDGSLVVTTSEDGTARAFETERGQCLRVLTGE